MNAPRLLLLVLLILLANCALGKERCVPKSDEEWLCGANVTRADAVPVSRTRTASEPPAFLRAPGADVERGMDRSGATAEPPSEQAQSESSQASAPVEPSNLPSEPATQAAGAFGVQLALTGTAQGFPALLKRLGLSAAQTQTLRLRDGRFVLMYGRFDSLDAARAAIPFGATGAFARALSALDIASD
jgi:hypothetical protein